MMEEDDNQLKHGIQMLVLTFTTLKTSQQFFAPTRQPQSILILPSKYPMELIHKSHPDLYLQRRELQQLEEFAMQDILVIL